MLVNGIDIDSIVVGGVGTNCYIVRRENSGQCVVVDPGYSGRKIARHIHNEGCKLEDVFLTHGHFDHMMGVTFLMEEAGGRLCAFEEERAVLEDPGLNVTAMAGSAMTLQADVYFRDGQVYETAGMKFTVIHTPGHTKGSCCYYLKEEGILFSGDTLFLESVGRTDLPTGNDRQIIESLKEKVLALPEEVKVFPGHGPATEIGYERENNPYAAM